MYLSLQSSCSFFMMLCSLFAALHLSSQLYNAHPGITELLIHVLHTQATDHPADTPITLAAVASSTCSMQLDNKMVIMAYQN